MSLPSISSELIFLASVFAILYTYISDNQYLDVESFKRQHQVLSGTKVPMALDGKETVIDLEKNVFGSASTPRIENRRSLLVAVTLLQLIMAVIIFQNREVMDNLHQVLNSMLLSIITSGIAQTTIQYFRPVNYKRLLKFWVWGAINGVISAYWIDILVLRVQGSSNRILCDQLIGSPSFQLLFIVFNCIWEKHDIVPTLRQVYFKTLGLSYLIFPISSLVSFAFLPVHLIFPLNCIVTLIWTVILGLITG